jgi:hypothetical protein
MEVKMKFRLAAILFGAALLCAAMAPNPSFAVTQCTSRVNNIWTGDNGYIWLFLENGIAAYTPATDADTKNILAVTTAALLAGKTITIRFQADNVPCNSSAGTRSDVVGVYLNR